MSQDIDFSKLDLEESKPNFWKLENPGDSIEGIYVERKVIDNKLSGKKQALYTILQKDDRIIYVGGRSGNPETLLVLEEASQGEYIKLVYSEQKKPAKAGMNGAKIVKGFRAKDRKIYTEALDKFRQKGAPEMEGDVAIPPLN